MNAQNHGLDWKKELSDQQDTDCLAGVYSYKNIASLPTEGRRAFLPEGEIQKAKEDTQACASYSPCNGYEVLLNYLIARRLISPENEKWLRDNGYIKEGKVNFSDAWVAINSGTSPEGNSLKAPLQAIRDYGMIPEHMLPLEPWMTWDDFHARGRLTDEIFALGKEFKKRFDLRYERVDKEDFAKWLETDVIDVGGYAWPKPSDNGIYPSTRKRLNHAFLLWNLPQFQAFDSYPDSFDGDFEKSLASDYKFTDYGYRLIVAGDTPPDEQESGVIAFFIRLWRSLVNVYQQAV